MLYQNPQFAKNEVYYPMLSFKGNQQVNEKIFEIFSKTKKIV